MRARVQGICAICNDAYFPGEEITWNRRSTSPNGERFHVHCWNKARGIVDPTVKSPKVTSIIEDETDEVEETPDSVILPTIKLDRIEDPITDNITLTGKHSATRSVRTILARRRYPFLYGGPGGGKTYLVRSLADDMGLDFVLVSCSQDMLKSEILGSRSPLTGDYFSTPFRAAWENGGVILFDECGIAPGAFLNILNSAMEQKEIRFPDGERIRMHKNCFLVFADNSTLYGNDPLFPERQDVGGAFRDRLTYLEFEYDESLEYRILVSIFNNDTTRASNWHSTVKALRANLTQRQVPVFASPRFAYKGAEWLIDGVEYVTVVQWELYRGMSKDVISQVDAIVRTYNRRY